MHMEGNGDSAEEFCHFLMRLKGKAFNQFSMGGPKKPPYQFFPCNFYKRRIWPQKLSDF